MRKVPLILTALVVFNSAQASTEDILLRLRPEPTAPLITRIIATEKVLLDAAPAGEKGEWMQLDLKIPFEGYVPAATLTKGLAITQDTPVHFLPDANSGTITRAKDSDLYEIIRVSDDWATVRFNKELTTFFRADAQPSAVPNSKPDAAIPPTPEPSAPKPPALDQAASEPTQRPAPITIPAPRIHISPDEPIGQLDPNALPAENVSWQPAAPLRTKGFASHGSTSDLIMVSPDQTQAREANTKEAPPKDQPLRLLTGILVREIETTSPNYPIRLKSTDGRLIAYVDFSGIFIKDLSPYLDQRVYLRGQIKPVHASSSDLVIFVHHILPAN